MANKPRPHTIELRARTEMTIRNIAKERELSFAAVTAKLVDEACGNSPPDLMLRAMELHTLHS